MKKLSSIILLLIFCYPAILYAQSLLDATRDNQKVFLPIAIKIEKIPSSKIGTGFFARHELDRTKLIFTTNRHIVEDAEELKLTVPIKDSLDVIIKTITINVPLLKNSVKQYYIPDYDLDLALIIIDKSSLAKADPKSDFLLFSSLPFSAFTNTVHLFTGQEVIYTGYPLGLTVNGTQPLLRKGVIAGIDTLKNIIYLDADAFGGSSGSPVFIDLNSQANKEFIKLYRQWLVGIISSYVPSYKYLVNKETQKVEMVQTENSGIAVVVPAETIRKIAERFLSGLK